MTLNVSEKILFILAVVLGLIATASACYDDNHSPIYDALMVLSVTLTFLVAYGLVRSYIREYKMKESVGGGK